MPRITMVKTAAGPQGCFRAGKTYTVEPEISEMFLGGDDPAALDAYEAAELAAESRGETPEDAPIREPEPAPEPRGKRRAKRVPKKRGPGRPRKTEA